MNSNTMHCRRRFLILLILLLPLLPQRGWAQNWERVIGTGSDDVIWAVAVTSDGGSILGGYTQGAGAGQKDVLLMKVTASGVPTWTKVYGGAGNEECRCVTQTADGGYLVSGYSDSYNGNVDGLLFKVDASGVVQWSKTYGDAGSEYVYQHIEAYGRIFMAGSTDSYGAGGDDCQLTMLSQNGTTVWSRVFGGAADDELSGLVSSIDNAIAFSGATMSFGNDNEPLCGKIDTTGSIQWTRTYGSGISADAATGIDRDNGNGFLLSGFTRSFGNGGTDALLIRTDQTGATVWARTIGSTAEDAGRSVYNPMNGGFMLSGVTIGYGLGNMDYMLVNFDPNGFFLWSATYGSAGQDCNPNLLSDCAARNFVVDNPNNRMVFSEGSTGFSGGYDCFLMQTSIIGEIPLCNVPPINPFLTSPAMTSVSQTCSTFNPSGFDHLITIGELPASLTQVFSCGCTTNVNLGLDTAVCVGQFVVFNAGPGFADYQWSTGGTGQTISASTQGNYSVTVTDNNGCTAEDTVYLSILPLPEDFDIGDDTALCDGYSVLLDAGAGYDLYMWQDGATTQTYLAADSGIYSVSVSGACGIATDSIHLTLTPLPVFTVGADRNICSGENVLLDPGVFSAYLWQDNSTGQTYTAASTGHYSVTVTDSNGCMADDAMFLIVQYMPTFDLGSGGDLCVTTKFLLDAGSGVGIQSYIWQDGSNLQTYMVTQEGTYSVTVSNSCGSVSDSVYFPPCPDCIVDIPNAFTPNGDGNNDVLLIMGNGFTRVHLMIYNRYGEEVFETRDAAQGWNGEFNGKIQPNEVYYYYMDADCLNGQRIVKKGDITLLK